MNRRILAALMLVPLLLSCGKVKTESTNNAYKRYFNAWVSSNGWGDRPRTDLGSVIISSETGDASQPVYDSDTVYVLAEYTVKNSSLTVLNTTSDTIDKIRGAYDSTYYYGPRMLRIQDGVQQVGVNELIRGMNVGGRTVAAVPGWLMTTQIRSSMDDYVNNVSGEELIYDIRITGQTGDIAKWEIDRLSDYLKDNFPEVDPADTVARTDRKFGFYYIRTGEPAKEVKLLKDTVIYINYTCRTLDGRVIDTTYPEVARRAGIGKGGSSYAPVMIHMAETLADIKMGSAETTVIEGFSRALSLMNPYEKGCALCWSEMAYDESGSVLSSQSDASSKRIPPYSTLRFDIELVDKP